MSTAGGQYTIRVEGHLDEHWSDRLADLTIGRHDDGTSTLSGHLADDAQLHGVLTALRDIGATLREVQAGPPVAAAVAHPLQTERLTLRPARVEDAEATWAYRRLASVSEWLTGSPANLDGYRAKFADPDRLLTTLVIEARRDPGSPVIGDLMLRRYDAWAQREVAGDAAGQEAELGWVVDPAHHGRGYATEAVRELVRFCFEELRVRRVTANCFLANTSSWRLMERIGMRRETHAVRESLHRSGQWLDSVGYALLAEEWH